MTSVAASRIARRWGRSPSSCPSLTAVKGLVTSSEEGMAFDHTFGYMARHDAGA